MIKLNKEVTLKEKEIEYVIYVKKENIKYDDYDEFFDEERDEVLPMWDELCGIHVVDSENPDEDE